MKNAAPAKVAGAEALIGLIKRPPIQRRKNPQPCQTTPGDRSQHEEKLWDWLVHECQDKNANQVGQQYPNEHNAKVTNLSVRMRVFMLNPFW